MSLDAYAVLDAFAEIKGRIDESILKNHLETYSADFIPRSEKLAVGIFCNALEQLGCPIRSAAPGTKLPQIQPIREHQRLMDHVYNLLENRAQLITRDGNDFIRTSQPCPDGDIDAQSERLLRERPAQDAEIKLMQTVAHRYGECLAGQSDAVQVLFQNAKNRSLLEKLYATSDATRALLLPLKSFIQEVASGWSASDQPLRLLEVGAGTGGTSSILLSALAEAGVPVVYTMTDISPSLVTQASLAFKQYPFVEYRILDIEKQPPSELCSNQHIVLGSNVIHATADATSSLKHIRKLLRPDGFLIFHELTTQMAWADVVFGLFEGWWRFRDGRQHALQTAQYWSKILRSVGYGYVDHTEGRRAEADLQSLIFAMANDPE